MLRRAYVRGVTKALMDTGAIKLANEELAAGLADAVANELPEQPAGEVAPEATAEIAATLMDLAQNLDEASSNAQAAAEAAAGGGGGGGEEIPPELAAAMAGKQASLSKAAARLRRKLAEGDPSTNQGQTGTTITGTQAAQMNSPGNASTGEGKVENAVRPGGYAVQPVGAQPLLGVGEVGKQKEVPAPGMGDVGTDGSNEVKVSSLRQMIHRALRKQAEGTLITGDNPSQANTPAQAAQTTEMAQMDLSARPDGYANMGVAGVGQSATAPSFAAAAVGKEQEPAVSMGTVEQPGTNTVIEQSKMGEEQLYLQQFKQASAKYANALPFWMSQSEKVAAIQYLLSLSPAERNSVMHRVSKTAELPEALKDYVESKKEEGGEEEKKEEGKEEEKKEEGEEEEKKEAGVKAGDIIAKLRSLSRK